jgi:hypothetical protein
MSKTAKLSDFFKYDRATRKATIIIESPPGYWMKRQAVEMLEGSGFKCNSINGDEPRTEFIQTIADIEQWRGFIQDIWETAKNGGFVEPVTRSVTARMPNPDMQRVGGARANIPPPVQYTHAGQQVDPYLLECVYISGKLKIRPHQKETRLDHKMYCQFPADQRVHGAIYEVENVTAASGNSKFYRASGTIKRV